MTALRIDDLGASSKRYEFHRGKWLPYRELNSRELMDLISWLQRYTSSCTLAITACWVERDGSLTPYDKKFPLQAEVIRRGVYLGVFEVACHGLTHCIPGKHVRNSLRELLQGNRRWHREFIDALPRAEQVEHLYRARRGLEEMFQSRVSTLVPPGNVISEEMARRALGLGYDLVTCRLPTIHPYPSVILDDRAQRVFHDRDLKRLGIEGALARVVPPVTTVRDAYRSLSTR